VSARKRFTRPLGTRRYKRLFLIATEGNKTEPQYFAMLNEEVVLVQVQVIKGQHDSSPKHVLNRMEEHLRRRRLLVGDEAWLVIDNDQWAQEQIGALHAWTQQHANRALAVSNPMFEFWLLMHFEDGAGASTPQDCKQRLKRYLPDYDKGIGHGQISIVQVQQAIARAKLRDQPPCADWPRMAGVSTVYRLVEKILMSDEYA
jgi:RloB-like protein